MAETGVIAAIAVASAAVSAGTAVYSGIQANNAAAAQRAQYEEERRASAIQAEVEQAKRMQSYRLARSSQDALRAARGLDLGSPTGEAMLQSDTEALERDLDLIGYGASRADRRLGLAGEMATAQGEAALVSGFGNALGSLASGAGRIYGITNPRPMSGAST